MPYRFPLQLSVVRLVLCAALLAACPALAAAQSAIDPRLIEFLPVGGAGTSYQAEISLAGTSQVLQLISLGHPAVQADGMIRTDFAARLTGTPVPGLAYVSKIVTTGPLGTSVSAASNPFTFSPCTYRLALSIATTLPAVAGPGAVDVLVSGTGCNWMAVSSAPWLVISSGAGGSGAQTVAFTVTPNTGAAARTATIAIGPLTYTATQDAAAARLVSVATTAQLQAAVATLTSHTTIAIEPGLYRLTATLQLAGALTGVTIKGRSGLASDVILDGPGMTVDGGVPTALAVTGAVQGLQIANLTIQHFAGSAIRFDGGVQAPRLSNLRLVDSGDALIAATATAAGGATDGVLEGSSLEYTTLGTATAGGLDLRGAQRWTVRGNAFRNVRAPGAQLARAAVSASAGSSDTVVDGNLFVNCQVGIAFGVTAGGAVPDHQGGRITNNVIYRAPLVTGGPGITVTASPETLVLHNTVITSQTAAATIAYRDAQATHLTIANNLVDGPIQGADNAWALLTGNVTNATSDWFVYAAGGDLHLRPTATLAIDRADPAATVPTDIDGQARGLDGGNDVGADEVRQGTEPPTVQVSQPGTGHFTPGTTVPLTVTAAGAAPIALVDLYVNAVAIARLTTAPYVASLALNDTGSYTVVAVAVDTTGGRTASQPLVIVIATDRQ